VTGQDPILPDDQQSIARWFNTDAYTLNALGTFGNAGRNTSSARASPTWTRRSFGTSG
jgi:hypothetical protein